MDYIEKIKHLESEVKRLKILQAKENLKGAPDIVGKYFKPFANCVLKVIALRRWDGSYSDVDIDCETINISKESVSIDLDTFYNDITLGEEITKDEYNDWLKEAITFINKLK